MCLIARGKKKAEDPTWSARNDKTKKKNENARTPSETSLVLEGGIRFIAGQIEFNCSSPNETNSGSVKKRTRNPLALNGRDIKNASLAPRDDAARLNL